ncbi:MAG TPA: hypothetical protein VH684_20375 [Xanthobacteraceae bacterium]|jgi:hypothetical protein
MSAPSDCDPADDLQNQDAFAASQSDAGTAATDVDPPGGVADHDWFFTTAPIPADTLNGVAHTLADIPSATSYMPCEAVDSVGSTLDHLVNTTNLFDVPPFDFDGPTGC